MKTTKIGFLIILVSGLTLLSTYKVNGYTSKINVKIKSKLSSQLKKINITTRLVIDLIILNILFSKIFKILENLFNPRAVYVGDY